MNSGHAKKFFTVIFVTAVIASTLLAPQAQALKFNFSDDSLSYLVVSGTPDTSKPGDTVSVSVSGKLAVETNESILAHVKFYVDAISEPKKLISEGGLLLPANTDEGAAQYSVAIPSNVINGTYLYMSITVGVKTFPIIYVSLVQNPAYSELQSQLRTLQAQKSDLEASNSNLTAIVYIAVLVAVIFIATTAYILMLTFRVNKNRKERASSQAPTATSSSEAT
jgi:hypothetical protein